MLATVVRETIGAVSEARKLGYAGDFFGSPGSYIPAVAKLGGKALEGMYNLYEIPNPYRDNPANSKLLNQWLDGYKARFNEDAELWGVFGWFVMDLLVRTPAQFQERLRIEDPFMREIVQRGKVMYETGHG